MAKDAQVVLEWADGEYLFALKGAQIEALEAECPNPETGKNGIGFGAIWQRVMDGHWFIKDLRNIIRHGLIGGGMGPVEANRLCRDYVDAMPVPLSGLPPGPDSTLSVAQAVLAAAVVGIKPSDEPEGPPPDLTAQRDFDGVRAMLLDFGVDPRAADDMTLGELGGMLDALKKRREDGDKPVMTAEDFEALKETFRHSKLDDEVF